MTPEEVVLLGEKARQVLNNDTLMGALTGFAHEHLNALLSTSDNDAEGRERHFRQYRAFETVINDLKARVAAAETIIQEAEPNEADDLDPDKDI